MYLVANKGADLMQIDQDTSIAILIVEDDVVFQQVLDFGLKSHGYKVATVGNGVDALELLLTETFDLVVTDLLMPLMDGLDLATQIKGSPVISDIPIVLMSGRKLETRFDEHSVFAAMLTKPFSLEELENIIMLLVPR